MTLTEIPPVEVSGKGLTLPDLPEEYLDIVLIDNNDIEVEEIIETFPLAVTDVTTEDVLEIRKLTNGDDVKEVYLLELSNKMEAVPSYPEREVVCKQHLVSKTTIGIAQSNLLTLQCQAVAGI